MSNPDRAPRVEFKEGLAAEKYFGEFMECKKEELEATGEGIFERVEMTQKGDKNDQQHIDAFVTLKGNLPCAIDVASRVKGLETEAAKRVMTKQKHQSIVSFKCRLDERGKPISGLMPFFVIDDVNLEAWNNWGIDADNDGVPITDVMTRKQQEDQYRFILGKMWEQSRKIEREGTNDQRRRIKPYEQAIEDEFQRILAPDEFEAFLAAA